MPAHLHLLAMMPVTGLHKGTAVATAVRVSHCRCGAPAAGRFANPRPAARLPFRRRLIPARSASGGENEALLPAEVRVRDPDQYMREGASQRRLLLRQATKLEPRQSALSDALLAFDRKTSPGAADVVVVGCGPSGLSIAAELASRGVDVVLVGMESKFTNNYGVWVDEFKALGMEDALDCAWEDAQCHFGINSKDKVNVGRAYGRVERSKLRSMLLQRCAGAKVRFLEAEVVEIDAEMHSKSARIVCQDGSELETRMVVLASGATAGKFLKFEDEAPQVAAQTAYGIEAVVSGYDAICDKDTMLFMDYRRHHTGLYDGQALKAREKTHPLGFNGLWGTSNEVPSFLYAMPLPNGRVFLEETALVARPELPFSVLKRRLERRLRALGIQVDSVEDEEWSYIPVGGPLPVRDQPVTAFGAAANMVHPATGYSLARSMREAPQLAAGIAEILQDRQATVGDLSKQVWDLIWPRDKQSQASFHVFGMELLAGLSPQAMNEFFQAFFSMPQFYWRGFLGSSLSAVDLLVFALLFFTRASNGIRMVLLVHLATSSSTRYMIKKYAALLMKTGTGDAAAVAAAALLFQIGDM